MHIQSDKNSYKFIILNFLHPSNICNPTKISIQIKKYVSLVAHHHTNISSRQNAFKPFTTHVKLRLLKIISYFRFKHFIFFLRSQQLLDFYQLHMHFNLLFSFSFRSTRNTAATFIRNILVRNASAAEKL